MHDPAAESDQSSHPAQALPGIGKLLGLFVGFGALVLLVYRECLNGPFLSDDVFYYLLNPSAATTRLGDLLALFDPRHPAHLFSSNYAPLHLVAVAAERRLFGTWMPGYHAVNLILHTANAVLLVVLLRSSRVPERAALLGGLVFVLHPANVEAVAWISQLKSVASLTLGLLAMLCLERAPILSLPAFLASLLTKFASVAFLPMALVLAWVRGSPRRTWGWLAGWAGALAFVSVGQLYLFSLGGGHEIEVYRDPFEQLRSIVAIGARYAWMAASGTGLSTFHDPAPARSWLDPWWLAGLALGVALAWRLVGTLRRREEEAAWWVLALAAFLPVSQLVPFRFPVADRYLYFMLPGLIGGTWLAGLSLQRGRLSRDLATAGRSLPWVAATLVVCLSVWLGMQAMSRMPLWLDDLRNLRDSARNYPEGTHGLYFRAVEAARRGDAERAVAVLRELEERTRFSLTKDFARDPRLAYLHDEPVFQEFVHDLARWRIEFAERRGLLPGEKAVLAQKYADLGDYDTAIALLEESLREGDHRRDQLIHVLEQFRVMRQQQQRDRTDATGE